MIVLIGLAVFAVISLWVTIWALNKRRVVPTDEVHTVQNKKATVSYGKDQEKGNVYYEWPVWLPFIGVQVKSLPVSVFSLRIENYDAYDKGRVPFVLDLEAFFRITDSNMAAQRVSNTQDLLNQLRSILQGAARTILASKDIEEILEGRAAFGEAFTSEVQDQLKNWGISPVKNIELMDIRDGKDSKVIQNIMEKKKSLIEMQSRIEVASNLKQAENAEIDARREIDINKQLAAQQVGLRTAEKEREVGIANEQAQQKIKEQQKITTEKQMEVAKVGEVKTAEINKEVNIVKATEQRETEVIKAEGEKRKTVLVAEGVLEAKKREAEGIAVEGTARADAEKAMQLAPVEAQIVLAKEIGTNEGYQSYLVTIRQVEAQQQIGIAQAAALEKADVKVIANAGDASTGMKSAMDIFSSKGGTNLGAMLEGLANTDQGKALLSKFGVSPEK
jgi:flotillin